MRKLETYPSEGKNSLQYWWKIKNPLSVVFNFLVIYTARYMPSLALKRFMYRLVGIKVGKNVSVGLGVVFDIFFPELIEIDDNCVIGYNTVILAHEYLIDKWKKGKIKIGKNVMIGANSTILAGVEIRDNAKISAMSLVNRDVEENTFVGGVPIKDLKGESV